MDYESDQHNHPLSPREVTTEVARRDDLADPGGREFRVGAGVLADRRIFVTFPVAHST